MSAEAEHPPIRQNLELLSRVRARDGDGVERQFFANIIELGSQGLLLESSRELEVGGLLVLNVVFPGQRHYETPVVSLPCAVRKVHDEPNLHYDLAITVLDKQAHKRLHEYLARPSMPPPADPRGVT